VQDGTSHQRHPDEPGQLSERDLWVLAYNPEVGAIFRCRRCRNIHLSLGPMRFQVVPETFMALVDLFMRSAAAFEVMLETQWEERCE